MIKKLLTLLLLQTALCWVVFAQKTYVPDSVFEAYLDIYKRYLNIFRRYSNIFAKYLAVSGWYAVIAG